MGTISPTPEPIEPSKEVPVRKLWEDVLETITDCPRLSDEERSDATTELNQILNGDDKIVNTDLPSGYEHSFATDLSVLFNWANSPSGVEFWNAINKKLYVSN